MGKKRKKRMRILGIKFYILLLLFFIFLVLVFLNKLFLDSPQYAIKDIPSASLEKYFTLEKKHSIYWYYFAAIDELEKNDQKVNNDKNYNKFISYYWSNEGDIEKGLSDFGGRRYKKNILKKIKQFEQIDQVYRDKVFPISKKDCYEYDDTWGAKRSYGGERSHEGTDIIADKGTPVLSVAKGKITNIGWNELGGWRVGIKGEDGIYYYYAHLDRYKEHIKKGKKVDKGETLGYVGNTGYGSKGTSGKFIDHLHFGMYENEIPINPYPFLKAWEENYN
ncbi:M23 family metallopeptidase [Garciella nitratireducens]|uniref:Peptidase family M23 n=1 Tax=Garciella nitratireducens DSM 15102 TaxID=1121911 RepID=A0A1T4KPX7_9FIRM|nr:M23 family metallopeptidase [Garciella nitratireducens]RBP40261.1 peptidase M23-like protein [Garciella nitratireducens]SJZ44397.1 Peptidase family M23 [Garciella nitratireducens DSM 15102]